MASLVTLPNGHLALNNNEVYTIALIDHDANGNVVPMPAGDVVSVAAAGTFAASLSAALDSAGTGVVLTPMVVESDAGNSGGGISIVLTDSAGLTEDSATQNILFDIVVPPPGPAVTEGLDLTNVTMASQPTPSAPGP